MGRVARGVRPAAVVMTATLSPPQLMPCGRRADPALRLKDYLDAFDFYLGLSDQLVDRIILLENSDADLSVFRWLANARHSKKEIQLLNTTSDYPAEKGKGYGEFLMLDRGLQTAIANQTQWPGLFWKVTGRLKVLNLEEMIARAPGDYDIYCDLRDVPLVGEMLGGNQWMELRLFSFSSLGYNRYIRGKYDLGAVLEKELFHVLKQHMHEDGCGIIPRFNVQPELQGYCGLSNESYQSLGYRTKGIVRKFSRALLPQLWL
jgi:hypothetical protein